MIPLALLLALVVPPRVVPADMVVTNGEVYAHLAAAEVVLGNAVAERRWRATALVTTRLADKRPGGVSLTTAHPDFALLLDGVRLSSDLMKITHVSASPISGGGVRVTFDLSIAGLVSLVRTVEAYPGIAGFAARTWVSPLIPLPVSGYTLDEVAVGAAKPAIHAFRAGADWREPAWKPGVAIGDAHTGDWRADASAAFGKKLAAPGEWMSLANAAGRRTFLVMERRDYSSSRMSYDGATSRAVVDLSRDVIYLGPFEEMIHAENPTPLPAHHRVLLPLSTTELEPVFTGLGANADDEPWQFYKYLTGHRLTPYPKAVTFNTNPIDDNTISTGSKDDVDFARFVKLAQAARDMGVDTFIFDDGWQATSGDWCPDSAACPEPRAPRFPPRFPDDHFQAVREVLKGDPSDPSDDMALGLWMNPMEFHPAAAAFKTSPTWACAPVGLGTAAANLAQPDSGSNEAGIGVWNPEALGLDPDTHRPEKLIDYMEGRIRRAIDVYGATYFKFDFLVWADCAGVFPVDMYAYRDSFVAMLDRLQRDHPEVTFQIDETNDYRLFPFESVARGPSWFQNGAPEASKLLHNLWDLAPYIPGFSLGQHALGNSTEVASHGIDSLMAVALGSHITFWTDIDTALTTAQRAQVKRWTDFYRANRDALGTFTYPLLGDPVAGGWAALQPWNPDTATGFLLAYRQAAANATQSIALRGIPATGTFSLTLLDPATGGAASLGTADAATLRSGLGVTIPAVNGYAIIRIEPL